MNAANEMKRLQDEANLLGILVDSAPMPKKHRAGCGEDSNECPKCVYDVYSKELREKREAWSKEREAEDRAEFEAWKKAGRPKA